MSRLCSALATAAVLLAAGRTHAANPVVCGEQAALGTWLVAQCPPLHDDGQPPDETANDGIFSGQVTLSADSDLQYKILPTGQYSSMDITQATTCAPAGVAANGNINVPGITAGPARFYYDSNTGSGGDSLMFQSPAASPPQWLAVGDFQTPAFDPSIGAVALAPAQPADPLRPGVLVGELVVAQALPAGWQWKVMEATGSYSTAREYGPTGWTYPGCTITPAAVYASAVPAGARLRFTFAASLGNMQVTVVSAGGGDMAGTGIGLGDLGSAPGDLGGAPADGGVTAMPLGIHCAAAPAGAGRSRGGRGDSAVVAALGLVLLALRGRAAFGKHRDC